MSTILILAFVLSALQVGDAVTTILAIRSGAIEKNPIAAWLMDNIGMVPALAIKVVFVSGGAIWAATHHPTQPVLIALAALIAIYAYVVIQNARLIK